MTEQLSRRVEALEMPMTIEMSKRSRELTAKGVAVINLSLGEPDFNTPDFIKEAAVEAIRKDFSHYTPVPGYNDLREAVSVKFRRDNSLSYDINQIVVSTGAKQVIANLMLSLINPGDEVLIPAPYWVSYLEMAKFCEGTPVVIPATLDSGFKITPQQLEGAITPRSRLMIFSSPNNPSGSMYSRDEMEALVAVLRRHPHVFVISDEIYEYIRYGYEHVSIASFEGMYERTATVNGLSKGFAMTGWRIGYMGCPAWLAKACDKIQSQFTSGANSIAQRAAIAALLAEPAKVQYMIDAFAERREMVLQLFSELPGFKLRAPEGAFYVFADISALLGKSTDNRTISNDLDLCMYLLEEGHVSSVPGSAFGLDNHIRFSFAASPDELRTAVKNIARVLKPLRA